MIVGVVEVLPDVPSLADGLQAQTADDPVPRCPVHALRAHFLTLVDHLTSLTGGLWKNRRLFSSRLSRRSGRRRVSTVLIVHVIDYSGISAGAF